MTVSSIPVFWLLVAIGVASLFVFLERLLWFRRAQIDAQDFIKGVINVLGEGNADEAIAICDDAGVPVSNVVAVAVRNRNGSITAIRDAVDSQGRLEVGRFERRLGTLSILGQVAPLLGLLGTVLGFIRVIRLVDSSEILLRGRLVSLSMDSLVTAALGLAIAIAVTVMHGVLRSRLDRIIVELESAASGVIGYLISTKGEK